MVAEKFIMLPADECLDVGPFDPVAMAETKGRAKAALAITNAIRSLKLDLASESVAHGTEDSMSRSRSQKKIEK